MSYSSPNHVPFANTRSNLCANASAYRTNNGTD